MISTQRKHPNGNLFNTLTAKYEYFRNKKENLRLHIQMHLSKNILEKNLKKNIKKWLI